MFQIRERLIALLVILIFALLSGCTIFSGEVTPDPQPPIVENNIVSNPSFEDLNENNVPVGYLFTRLAGEAQAVVDTTIARSGNRSVRIDGDGQSRTTVTYQVRNIEGGQQYKASVWYRHDAKDQGKQVGATLLRLMAFEGSTKVNWEDDWLLDPFEIDYEIAGGENLHVFTWKDAPDEWVELFVTFSVPQNVDRVSIELFNYWGEGTVWFDDLSVVKLNAD